MPNNYSNARNAPTANYDDRMEQEAYDKLDPKLRWFIGNAPERLSCVWVLAQQHSKGVNQVIASGLNMIASRYPEFKWPNGAPW